jgi:hypothetical protein
MKIGVVADTHGYFDLRLAELLTGVDAILHAGDVGSQQVLDELEKIAPVQAIRGNVDPEALRLPLSLTRKFEDIQVEILHQLPVPPAELEKWSDGSMLGKMHPERRDAFLRSFGDLTRVVIFGHSHKPLLLTLGHKLFLNPGSAGQQRFSLPRCCGLLETFPRGVRGTVLSLERYNERLPGKVWLPIGGA